MARHLSKSLLAPSLLAPSLLALGLLLVATSARADDLYRVDSVTNDGGVVRVHASAGLAPVRAIVRERAQEAVERAAPNLLQPRDFGAYRLRDPRIEVESIRFAPGASSHEVQIELDALVTAEREDRGVAFRNFLPTLVFRPRGRVNVARARLVVGVRVGIADGRAVVIRIVGKSLHVSDPFDLDLQLHDRVLHTHAEPIPSHQSLAGLVPEAASLRGIDGDTLRFTVRFRVDG